MINLQNYIGRRLTTDEYAVSCNELQKQIKELENLKLESGPDRLLLKWGGLKGHYYDNSPKGKELIQELYDIGISSSAMCQKNTGRQKEILCELIDITDGIISSDWSGEKFTKEEAKKYILKLNK